MINAVINQKGGAGKTTTAQNLGAALSRFHGERVLLIDADPQASLTVASGLDEIKGITLYEVLIEGADIADAVEANPNGCGYDLVPSDIRLARADMALASKAGREFMLKKAVAEISEGYDRIIIDCPPSLSVLTLNALVAADGIIIPMKPAYLHQSGLADLINTMDDVSAIPTVSFDWAYVLFTLCEKTNHAREIMEDTKATLDSVFDTKIRKNTTLEEAAGAGMDVFQYDPRSNGAADYRSLAEEIRSL